MKHISRGTLLTLLMFVMSGCNTQDTGPSGPSGGQVTFKIDGLLNDNGIVWLVLFNEPDAFPVQSERAIARGHARIKNKSAEIVISNIPHGTYAAAVMHDENEDGSLPFAEDGTPLKAVGHSNNPPRGRQPTFAEAAFTLDEGKEVVDIAMVYYMKRPA